jgi:leucyl-tRNA synthetase
MELTNALYAFKKQEKWADSTQALDAIETLLKMLAPIAPHISEELWQDLHGAQAESVHIQRWPDFNPDYIVADSIELPVQVNGKLRARIEVASDALEETVAKAAKEAVAEYIEGKEIKKLIVIPGRIVTLVI